MPNTRKPHVSLDHIFSLHDAERAIVLKHLHTPSYQPQEDDYALIERLIVSHLQHAELLNNTARLLRNRGSEQPKPLISVSEQVAEWLGVLPKGGVEYPF